MKSLVGRDFSFYACNDTGTMKKTKTAVEETEEIEENEEETAIDILMQEDNNETLPPAEADKE